MGRRPTAVYDANVLYPAQLRDVLMRCAVNDGHDGLVDDAFDARVASDWHRQGG